MTDYEQLRKNAAKLRQLVGENHWRLSKVARDFYVTKEQRCFVLLNASPLRAHTEGHLDKVDATATRLREKLQDYDPSEEAVVHWDPDKDDRDISELNAVVPLHEDIAP
jgi:hypothetical protein